MYVAHFTPVASLVGGLLIGLASALLWILNGRVAGITGIVGELFRRVPGESRWRLAFIAGRLLVGFGTRLANGCTSGHGLCGVSRLSPRSIAATCVFMAVGMATVF